MSKYYVFGKRADLEKVLAKMQEVGAFHINYFERGLGLRNFRKDFSNDIELHKGIMEFLTFNKQFGFSINQKFKPMQLSKAHILSNVVTDIKRTQTEIALTEPLLEKCNVLLGLGVTSLDLLNSIIPLVVIKRAKKQKLAPIRSFTLKSQEYDLVRRDTLEGEAYNELDLKDMLDNKVNDITKYFKTLKSKKEQLILKLTRDLKRYRHLLAEYGSWAKHAAVQLHNEINIKREIHKIADEGNLFIVSAFVPSSINVKEMDMGDTKIIESAFKPEEAPTLKSTLPIVKQFSFLTWLYGVPSYDEADPSLIIAITFPLLFGAIIGDVGYGLVLLAGTAFLYFSNRAFAKNLAVIFLVSSLSSIVFGLLFGEFFGNLIPLHALFFPRLDNVLFLIIGTVFSGTIILTISAILRLFDSSFYGNKKDVISAIGWLGLNVFILTETLLVMLFNTLNLPLVILMFASIALIGAGNTVELTEVINLFTNAISYLRIAAVGLSSIMIAMLINQLGFFLLGYSVILAVFAFVMLHTLNILLDALIAFLQSLRLEYVEFLSRFFKGRGHKYKPLSKL